MKKAMIVLQARRDSRRLPGKVLRPLQGLPVLAHCIRRLKSIHPAATLVVATSVLPANDEIARLAETEGALSFRGSEEDVLDRIYRAACRFEAECIVRATADNPLVDPEEAGRVLKEMTSGPWDYVCGFKEVDGFAPPVGVAVEAFRFEPLECAWRDAKRPDHREHINDYFFENHEQFRIKYLPCLPRNHCPDLRLTVDTIDDLKFIERMGMDMTTPLQDCTTVQIIEWWRLRKGCEGKDDLHKN